MKQLRAIRRRLRQWWRCYTHRCDYYTHYLAYGPPELCHAGFHAAEKMGARHWDNCNSAEPCSACFSWERRLSA